MENYKIIRNGNGRQWKYDFTLKNGLNLLVSFEARQASESAAPTHLAVYDRDRNNITDQILKAFFGRQESFRPIANQDDVHSLIDFCKSMQKDQISSALGYRQNLPSA